MMREIRELEKKLGLAPVDINLFGEHMFLRGRAMQAYLQSLRELDKARSKSVAKRFLANKQ